MIDQHIRNAANSSPEEDKNLVESAEPLGRPDMGLL